MMTHFWEIFIVKEVDKHGYYIVTMMEGRAFNSEANKLHTERETKTILLMERSGRLCVINERAIPTPIFHMAGGFLFYTC